MPRNVRNFWIELDVDGRKHRIATGPRSRAGGFTMRVLMRENGEISEKEFHLEGFPTEDENGTPYVRMVGTVVEGRGSGYVVVDRVNEA